MSKKSGESLRRTMIVVACTALMVAPAQGQGITKPKQGQGGSVVKGAAGTDGSKGDNGLEHCDKAIERITLCAAGSRP